MIIKQLSVFLENKPGRLNAALGILASHKVDLRALSLADSAEYGMLRLVVDKPDESVKYLKEAGIFVKCTDVVAVTMENKPGGTTRVLELLEQNGISVEYMYAGVGSIVDKAWMVMRTDNMPLTEKVIQQAGCGDISLPEFD